MKSKKLVNEELNNVHFVGKDHFYIDREDSEKQIRQQARKLIEKQLTKKALALDNYNMELPKPTEEEMEQLIDELIGMAAEQELRRRGATDEEIEELKRTADEAVQKMIQEHQEHIDGFKIVK